MSCARSLLFVPSLFKDEVRGSDPIRATTVAVVERTQQRRGRVAPDRVLGEQVPRDRGRPRLGIDPRPHSARLSLPYVRVLVFPPSREWPELRAAAIEAERIGFDGILVPDHLTFGRQWLEALTTMAALAEATKTVELCFGVISATFRPPAVLARAIDTLDRISSGRLHAGLGAGVDEAEHRVAGLPFGSPGERLQALERSILAIRDLCEHRVPIVIGASGDRALALVARYADEWNCGTGMYLDRAADRAKHLSTLSRDRDTPLRRSVNLPILMAPPQDSARARQYNLDIALLGDVDTMVSRVREIRDLGFDTVWLGGHSAEAFERAAELLPHLKEL